MIRAPTRRASAGDIGNGLTTLGPPPKMTSPYLQQRLLPLSVALPQMLDKIESKLANEKLEVAEKERLRQRAQLIRGLLGPSQHP